MKFLIKRRLLILAASQFLILFVSYLLYQRISLLSYINISFYLSSALLITALLVYTIDSGFFDVISRSLNFAFTRGQEKRKFSDVPPLSELVTIDKKPLLFYGFSIGSFMLIALFLFYV